MVREFSLINEKNQKFSLMDIKNYCLLTEPTGLGMSFNYDYAQLGNVFVANSKKLEQGKIGGIGNFLYYDNYKKLIDFIQKSENLKLLYVVPYKNGNRSFYRDITIPNVGKTELGNETGILSEPITFDCLSLWYEPKQIIYRMEKGTQEIIWNFEWDSSWIGFNTSNIEFTNDGHTPASVQLELEGEVLNPTIELYVEGNLVQKIDVTNLISVGETFEYSSKENDFYIKKKLVNGTEQDLFDLDYINFNQNLALRLPKNKTSSIKLIASGDIPSAILTIFVYYVGV